MRKSLKPLSMSILLALASMGIVVGGTFALFTDDASAKVEIGTGIIDVSMNTSNSVTYSTVYDSINGDRDDGRGNKYSSVPTPVNGIFAGTGTAAIVDNVLTLERIIPGDRVVFQASVGDASNVSFKYRLSVELISTDIALGSVMQITTDMGGTSETFVGLKTYYTEWQEHIYNPSAPISKTINFDFELPLATGDEYQNKEAQYLIGIQSIQINAYTEAGSYQEFVINDMEKEETAVAGSPTVIEATNSDSSVSVKTTIPADTPEVADGSDVKLVVSELEIDKGVDQQTLNFDITLYVDNTPTSSFSNEIDVEIYVGKMLEITEVLHNGNPVTNWTYDPMVGIIGFSSSTFSPFQVTYQLMTRNTMYGFYDSYVVGSHWVHEVDNKAHLKNILFHIGAQGGNSAADDFRGGTLVCPLADLTTVYILRGDIDCEGTLWTAADVENALPAFVGILDGDGHTISDITAIEFATQVGDNDVACLFNKINDAQIIDLTMSHCIVDSLGVAKPGAIIAGGRSSGSPLANIRFSNVTIDGTCEIKGKQGVGAFLGYARGSTNLTFENCVNNADITCTGANVGGFTGSSTGNAGRTWSFINCTNNGNISGSFYIGGFIGTTLNGANITFENCANNGNIETTTGSGVGLFIGQNGDTLSYLNCTNSGYIYYSGNDVKTEILKNNAFSPAADPTVIHYSGEPENATKGDLANAFVVSTSIEKVTLSFDEEHNLHINGLTVEYDNAVLVATIGSIDKFYTSNSKWANSCGSNPVYTENVTNINQLVGKEVTRAGWFAPTADTETGSYSDDPSAEAKAWYERYRLPDEYKDTMPGGFYIDADGGYYILNNNASADTFDQIKQIWLTVEYRLVIYKDGATVATGYIASTHDADGTNPTVLPYVIPSV